MIDVFRTYVCGIVGFFCFPSFAEGGQPAGVDLPYFGFTSLTSIGFGDVVPISRPARALVVLDQVTGALGLAVLIARLAGAYLPQRR